MQVAGDGWGRTVLGRTYDRENCSAARTLELVGERWSLLILRDAMFTGLSRFTEFQHKLGIAPNILSSRLERFVAAGLMELRPVRDEPTAHRYVLTAKGLDLQAVVVTLTEWGDRWAAPQGPPIVYRHEGCGGRVHHRLSCEECRGELVPGQVRTHPGPGARPA